MTTPSLKTLLSGLDGLGADGLDSQVLDPDALDLTIHPDDAMYAFSERMQHGVSEQARIEYFRSGHHAWRVVDAALRQVLGPRWPKRRPLRLLDFGAGYGRVTRFLLPSLGTERMTSTEADADAVTFLREHFGFDAHETPVIPPGGAAEDAVEDAVEDSSELRKQLGQPDGFDTILALSVLTHLPERSFEVWLKAWLDALTVDGGVLLFSTLGSATLLPGREMPTSGFHFERMSESRVLDLDDYGTAWVTPDRVGRLLDRLTGGLARWKHVPLGLWNLQDLWLVTLDPRLSWGDDFELAIDQPTGRLESCRLDGAALSVAGWALGGLRPPRAARVELRLNGELVGEADTSGPRPDALTHLHLPATDTPAAFELRIEHDRPINPSSQLRLDVVDPTTGRRYVLHAGSVEAAELFFQLAEARAEADRWRRETEIFEASRWGRMRRAWMSWKSRFR